MHRRTRRTRIARGAAAGTSLLLLLAACSDDRAPTRPLDGGARASAVVATADGQPFYYFHGAKIFLDVDSTQLIIAARSSDPVRQALSLRGLAADSIVPAGVPNYWRVRIGGVPSAVARSQLRTVLKQGGSFPFVSWAYATHDEHAPIHLVDRVVVQFRSTTSPTQIDSLVAALGLHVERRPRPDSGLTTYWFSYPDTASEPLQLAAALDQHPLVEWADPDRLAYARPASTPSDPYFSQQVYLTNPVILNGAHVDIAAASAWDITKGSSSIRVAVVDVGIDGNHPEFSGRLDPGYDVYAGQFAGEDAYHPNPNDDHGTEVAGIIGAAHNGVGIAGVAPNVHLVSVRIIRFQTGQTDAQIADALMWAAQHADVVNNSWESSSYSQTIDAAIYNGSQQGRGGLGTVMVFAAGNDAHNDSGQPHGLSPEANSNTALAVGAIDANGLLADYSNTGIYSHGVVAISGHQGYPLCDGTPNILTTDFSGALGCNLGPGGDLNYTYSFNGTSAATPQVSGVAALLLSLQPSLTEGDVRTRILNDADVWGGSRPSNQYGFGKLNAYRVVSNSLALSVNITGPTFIDTPGTYTWTAHPGGGNGTYSYQWQESFNNGVSWSNVGGNSATYSETENSNGSFKLRVKVTSGSENVTSAALTVTVQVSGCSPQGC